MNKKFGNRAWARRSWTKTFGLNMKGLLYVQTQSQLICHESVLVHKM